MVYIIVRTDIILHISTLTRSTPFCSAYDRQYIKFTAEIRCMLKRSGKAFIWYSCIVGDVVWPPPPDPSRSGRFLLPWYTQSPTSPSGSTMESHSPYEALAKATCAYSKVWSVIIHAVESEGMLRHSWRRRKRCHGCSHIPVHVKCSTPVPMSSIICCWKKFQMERRG